MRPLAAHVAWSVCLSVCLLDTTVSCAKTDEPIEMRCGGALRWAKGPCIR